MTDRIDLDRTYSGISFEASSAQPVYGRDDRAHRVVGDLDAFLKDAAKIGYRYAEDHANGGRYTFAHPYKKCEASLMLIEGSWLLFNASKAMVGLTVPSKHRGRN